MKLPKLMYVYVFRTVAIAYNVYQFCVIMGDGGGSHSYKMPCLEPCQNDRKYQIRWVGTRNSIKSMIRRCRMIPTEPKHMSIPSAFLNGLDPRSWGSMTASSGWT